MEPFGADEHQKSSVDVARWRAARQGFLERTNSSHSTVATGGPAARLRREADLNAGSISSVTRLNWRFWSYPATLSRIVVAPASTYLCRLRTHCAVEPAATQSS